jgi:hypothetical protein
MHSRSRENLQIPVGDWLRGAVGFTRCADLPGLEGLRKKSLAQKDTPSAAEANSIYATYGTAKAMPLQNTEFPRYVKIRQTGP